MRRIALASVLALGLLAGCSSSAPARITAKAADPGAHVGGELRVGIVRPASIDPQLVATEDLAGNLVVRTMCDPLIGTDPASRELVPGVARSWKLFGSRSVQVQLRKDVRYSDGSKVEARDLVAALRRVVDPDVASPQSHLLSNVFGYPSVQEGKIDAASIPAFRVTNSDTAQIGLFKDDAQFVAALTLPFAVPVPRALAARASFGQHPVCVGPYRLMGDYTGTEKTIRLERTPGYKGLRSGFSRAGLGWADHITFQIYDTRAAALAALKSGAVDAAQVASGDVATARSSGFTVASATTGRLEYVGLPNRAPFNDPLVDAALSRALDRSALNKAAFHDTRTPAFNLIPPTLPDSRLPGGDAQTCRITAQGDLAGAKQLLAQAHVDLAAETTKVPLKLYFNDEFDNRAMAEQVKAQWARLGLSTVLTPISFDNLLARAQKSGGFDGAFRMTATAAFADQGDFVRPLVASDAFGVTNYTGYNGFLLVRRIEEKLQKAVPAADQKLQSLGVSALTCAVPIVPIAWYQSHLALSPKVVVAANDGVDAGAGLPDLRELAVG